MNDKPKSRQSSTPRKLITWSDRLTDIIEAIKRDREIRSVSSAIHYCIMETHRKLNPAYVRALAPLPVDEKVRRQEEVERIKLDNHENKLRYLCESVMQGKLNKDVSGHYTCDVTQYTYFTPNKVVKGERTIDEHEIEQFVGMQFNKFPENLTRKEKADLIAKAQEV